jgi:hypothetical protein
MDTVPLEKHLELIENVVELARGLLKDRERLLVLATKHRPNDHPDFAEIKKLAGDT